MAQTLTFDKVFTATGSKNGKEWKRWDFKVGSEKYSTFSQELADKIQVGQPTEVEIEVSGSNGYTNKTITKVLEGAVSPSAVQTAPELEDNQQAARSRPVTSQGHSDDAKGRTRAIIAAQLAPALFNSLPEDEQTMEAAKQIAEALVDYAFQS